MLKGNCYICRKVLSKSGFKKHIMTQHNYDGDNSEETILLKVEERYTKDYWLYLDIRPNCNLNVLDTFLRNIWLECCGHLSEFYTPISNISKNKKFNDIDLGSKLYYEYDFGTPTELVITVIDKLKRPKQKNSIRLIARNEPYHFKCANCDKEATNISIEYMWEDKNPFFCDDCIKKFVDDDELILPVVNSPRMGQCGYCGELDIYEFK